jgi:signal transduction histidine kinase
MAMCIGLASLWYTNNLVKKLAVEEKKKVVLWAEAQEKIITADPVTTDLTFLLNVIQENTTIPVIVADTADNILITRNLDSLKMSRPGYANARLVAMKETCQPIEIILPYGSKQLIYYDKSILLERLTYYPYIQLSVILIFIMIAYLAFSSSRRAEQNQVWVGLSKETAHQLGTPISSLLAIIEIMKEKPMDDLHLKELEKDILRLEKIASRFSKIGSKPKLVNKNIMDVLHSGINYIRSRTSSKVTIEFKSKVQELFVPLNDTLFEWVIESISKNAVDAMNGAGKLKIELSESANLIYIDFTDQGKGIPRRNHKTIFKPGYTTKERGWGLGLSLTKRIVEDYHNGKVFVQSSEIGKGTKIRIILKKQSTNKS